MQLTLPTAKKNRVHVLPTRLYTIRNVVYLLHQIRVRFNMIQFIVNQSAVFTEFS